MTAFFGNVSFSIIELRFGQEMDFVATNHCFPVESVTFIQDHFGELRFAIHPRGSAKQSVNFLNIWILAGFVIREYHGWMPTLPAERKHQNFPLIHGGAIRVSLKVFGRTHN